MYNMFQTSFLLGLPLAVPILADELVAYQETYGIDSWPPNADNITRDLIVNGRAHPNATRSVAFKPFAEVDELDEVEWTWRVNVSDFAVPNSKGSDGLDILQDPHIVDTSYDFTWSGGRNLGAFLKSTTDAFCIQNLDLLATPANISNTYTDDNTHSTDCTPMLGADCVDAVLHQARAQPGSRGCNALPSLWSDLPECAGSFGYIVRQQDKNYTTQEINDLNSPNGSVLVDGKTFWSGRSGTFNGSDTTKYEATTNQLQVMLVAPIILNVTRPQLVCMRVNTTHLDESSDDGSGGHDGDDEGAGSVARYQSGVGMIVALVWGLLAALYVL
ncbi:hypothetical protein GGS20DRAFT_573731 [Poronia punctata]|nr:hypothetical protein GGS20DRAFT_573731 [Poronia punctata]